MKQQTSKLPFLWLALTLVLLAAALSPLPAGRLQNDESAAAVIVQGRDLTTVKNLVQQVGGEVTHDLGIINAVGARLTPTQQAQLAQAAGISRLYTNYDLNVATPGGGGGGDGSGGGGGGGGSPTITEDAQVVLSGAEALHAAGLTGQGVTVAVIDTGT